jgi:putative sigma-54 modulation protein
MHVNITARHCELSQGFRDRITQEAESLRKIWDRINSAEVVLSEDAGVQRADVTIRLSQHVFNAKGQGASHQQAFGIALEKAERQLRKYKGKLVGRRNGHPKETSPAS